MSGKVVFGFIIFFLGLGLLLDRVGVINFGVFVSTWWPIVLIIVGFGNLFSSTKSKLGGVISLILGFSFLLVTTSVIDQNIFSFVWPVILIIIGLWLMLPFNKKTFKEKTHEESQIDFNTSFSYQMLKFDSKELIGGQISCVFSGLEIDLTKAEMTTGGTTIELNSVFSGIEIVVPKSWKVKVTAKNLFGGIESDLKAETETDDDSQILILTIKGVVIFSGIEIKGK